MGNYYGIVYSNEDNLAHYGVKGQTWGIRRYRNEDGSLTSEGRTHYGIGEARQPGSRQQMTGSAQKQAVHNYRVKKYGSASARTLEQKPKKLSKKEQQIRKTRAKRLLATAAVVGIGVASLYGLHRYNKTTENLIQTAKNQVHDTYKMGESMIKNQQERANHEYWRAHDMSAINSRSAAKKALHLNNSKQTRSFIKANKLASRKTSEIIEKRTGPLVEGYHRSKRTGRLKKISERKRRKMAEMLTRGVSY